MAKRKSKTKQLSNDLRMPESWGTDPDKVLALTLLTMDKEFPGDPDAIMEISGDDWETIIGLAQEIMDGKSRSSRK